MGSLERSLVRFNAAVKDLLSARILNPENIKLDEGCERTLAELKELAEMGKISPVLYAQLKKVLSGENCVYSPFVESSYDELRGVKSLEEALNKLANAYEEWFKEECNIELSAGSLDCQDVENIFKCHCKDNVCVCNSRLDDIDEKPPFVMICEEGEPKIIDIVNNKLLLEEIPEEYLPDVEQLIEKYYPYAEKYF